MILADKIILLRKQQNWSQEQLADRLGVSRQSVSKWESGLSIPDLDKIIKMSGIFGVSTDYLLKDEVEELPRTATNEGSVSYDYEESRLVTVEDAHTYMNLCEKLSSKLALGVAICICSPLPLIALGGLSENPLYSHLEDIFGGIGVAVLLIIVAIGTALIITSGMQLGKWEFLEKEKITLEYGVKGIVEKKKSEFEKLFITAIASGVVLCIVGIVPLMIAAGFDFSDFIYTVLTDVMLVFIAAGVFLFVKFGIVHECYEKLLQEGEYTDGEKRVKRKLEPVATVYWCTVVALYLFRSFTTMEWHRTWIIWPIAGVLYAVVEAVVKLIINKK